LKKRIKIKLLNAQTDSTFEERRKPIARGENYEIYFGIEFDNVAAWL
jgi:hypothetical protein